MIHFQPLLFPFRRWDHSFVGWPARLSFRVDAINTGHSCPQKRLSVQRCLCSPISLPSRSMSTEPKKPQPSDFTEIAGVCATFVKTLFNGDGAPRVNVAPPGRAYWIVQADPTVPLPEFIQYVLYLTLMPKSVVFAALMLLQRLKAMYPMAGAAPRSNHGLFLVSYMISTKTHSDISYSNKDWTRASGKMFQLRELNGMESEMLKYLRWNVNVDVEEAALFRKAVIKDYNGQKKPKIYAKAKWPSNTVPGSMPHASLTPILLRSRISNQTHASIQTQNASRGIAGPMPHPPSTGPLKPKPTPMPDRSGPSGLPAPNHNATASRTKPICRMAGYEAYW